MDLIDDVALNSNAADFRGFENALCPTGSRLLQARTFLKLCPYVVCHAKRSAQAIDITLDILMTFARMAEHLLNALPCAAASSISIHALLVVTLMIDLRADHLRRY